MFVWAGAVAALGYDLRRRLQHRDFVPLPDRRVHDRRDLGRPGRGAGAEPAAAAAPAGAPAAIGLAALLAWRALAILPQVDASGDRPAIGLPSARWRRRPPVR
ncbi:MAG: hypothetical protein U0Z44_17005 [Kouleothrix sp.]